MHYIYALLIMSALYFTLIPYMKRITNYEFTNLIFAACVFIPYIIRIVIIGFDVGISDWNFLNTMPTANISPFMFFIVPFIFVMPPKLKKHFHLLIALMCVGMFAAGAMDCIRQTVTHYRLNMLFILDQFCHIALSLWGVYLVKSKQVNIDFKSCLKGASIIVAVALFMMVLNVVFDTSFFGLSLNSKHNIYLIVLTENSYLSALIYFTGLISVLAMGYGVIRFLTRKERGLETMKK